jgi:hypothetical protein
MGRPDLGTKCTRTDRRTYVQNAALGSRRRGRVRRGRRASLPMMTRSRRARPKPGMKMTFPKEMMDPTPTSSKSPIEAPRSSI